MSFLGLLPVGSVAHEIVGVDGDGHGVAGIVQMHAVVALDNLERLAADVDVILYIQTVIFSRFHGAGKRNGAGFRVLSVVHMDALETDVVVVCRVKLRAFGVELFHDIVRETVDVADEVAHEFRGGVVVNFVRRADLLDHALVEHRDAVGKRKSLLLIVGDVNARDAEILLHLLEFQTKLHAELGVQVGERLVQTDDRRLGDERAGDGDALLLAAGELRHGFPELLVRKIDLFGDSADFFVHLGLLHFLDAQTERDVVVHGHRREERVALEHDADVPVLDGHMGDVLIADEHLALGRLDKAGDF